MLLSRLLIKKVYNREYHLIFKISKVIMTRIDFYKYFKLDLVKQLYCFSKMVF